MIPWAEDEYLLCYVAGSFAYFTTRPLHLQWGDDWDDKPYEHNAGSPYEPGPEDLAVDGTPQWDIRVVAFDGPFEEPRSGHLNSGFSVDAINSGAIAWLRPDPCANEGARPIPAGTTLPEFRRLVALAGGVVYEAATPADPPIGPDSPFHPARHYFGIKGYVHGKDLVEAALSAVESLPVVMLSRYMQERLEIAARRIRERLDDAYGKES